MQIFSMYFTVIVYIFNELFGKLKWFVLHVIKVTSLLSHDTCVCLYL